MNDEKQRPSPPKQIDVREMGAPVNGEPQYTQRRLFCQLHVYKDCHETQPIIDILEKMSLNAVLYEDMNHPTSVGILFMEEDPAVVLKQTRLFHQYVVQNSHHLTYRPEMTMTGRTYASGREPNLEEWLLKKPLQNALNPDYPWAIWYPLRRKPEFYQLEQRDRSRILGEHAMLGRTYATGGYASDIRLTCFGLDTNDNEFVIGLVGPELSPLSKLIQDMRKTQQTTKYIESLGPFFIGKVLKQFQHASIEK